MLEYISYFRLWDPLLFSWFIIACPPFTPSWCYIGTYNISTYICSITNRCTLVLYWVIYTLSVAFIHTMVTRGTTGWGTALNNWSRTWGVNFIAYTSKIKFVLALPNIWLNIAVSHSLVVSAGWTMPFQGCIARYGSVWRASQYSAFTYAKQH